MNQNNSNLKELIIPFYQRALSVNKSKPLEPYLEEILSEDFRSLSTLEAKNKNEFIDQIKKQWNLLPDLKWEPQAIFQDGDHIFVRSLVSGSPNGDFFGMHLDGIQSFKIMTMETFKFQDQKICEMHHLAEWIAAIKQLCEPAQ